MYIILSSLFAVMLIAILLIIVKAKTKGRIRKKSLKQSLEDAASERQISWTQSEIQLYRALGWCKEKRLFLFHHFTDNDDSKVLIDMSDIVKCKLVEERSPANKHAQESHVIAVWIELQDKNSHHHKLCFYHELQDGVFEKTRLSQKAKLWIKMIEQH